MQKTFKRVNRVTGLVETYRVGQGTTLKRWLKSRHQIERQLMSAQNIENALRAAVCHLLQV